MDFSRLDDTKFPNLETASPYALKNTFDYTRWVPNTKVHLVNVLWNGDYSNVVKFENDTARDKWFDNIKDSYELTLTSNARIVPDGTVKLPLPYDVAARYNYLYIDIPLATSRELMIQNETESGLRRWFFFIGDVSYSAPNTTIIQLQPDVWTNFIDDTRVTYMMLERGHAPVSATDTDTYLSNPIENNKYLLAPDVNYDDTDVVKDSKFIPFGNGTKYICIASTVGYKQIQNNEMGEVGTEDSWSSPTYSDTYDWFGYQLQVNGYAFGNGKDYSKISAPVNIYNRPGSLMPTGLDVYAIPADDSSFLADVREKSPAFLRTIQALFVVDENMITKQTKLSFLGHTIYYCLGNDKTLDNYELNKDMFGFDSEHQRFAKLYTYPYSRIEVSDNTGNTAEVRIENTGKIGMRMLTSVAFPVLDFKVFLTGIGGVGSQQYSWKNLNGDELSKMVTAGDWDKFLFEFDIPTFALYMDAETAWYLDSYGTSVSQARRNALTTYHNTVRSANLGYTNNTASTNNARDNAVRQANTAATNGYASNDTANTNAQNSASTANTNAQNSASTLRSNTNNLASCNYNNVNLTIAANNANTTTANSTSSTLTYYKNSTAVANTSINNGVCKETAKEDNCTSIATTKNTGEASFYAGALNGAVSGASAGGDMLGGGFTAFAGAIIGAVSANVTASAANDNATIIAQANSYVTALTTGANSSCTSNNVSTATASTNAENNNRTNQNNNTNSCLAGQRDNNYNTSTTNANNLYNTQSGNATRTYNTDSGNASRTKSTADANTGRTNDTSVTNANNTQSTDNANTGRTREIGILNAKENLENAQATSRSSMYDAKRKAPVQLTTVSGDGAQMYHGLNGLQFRLRTQTDSAINQTAAQFARFGYALNQMWDVADSGLNLMENFTYWKASDIWVDVKNVASSEVCDSITDIFKRGVTVWSNPDKIGKVSVYDN